MISVLRNRTVIRCTKCKAPVPKELFNGPGMTPCRKCRSLLQVAVFPAQQVGTVLGLRAEKLIDDEKASCFFHPGNQAVIPCDSCGRFLCSVCDVEIVGQHLCPACIEVGSEKKENKLTAFDSKRFLYDSLAIRMAILPLVVTPLISLYLAMRHWSAPRSITHPSCFKWIVAIVIAIIQLALWGSFFLNLVNDNY